MQKGRIGMQWLGVMALTILALSVPSEMASAKSQPKTYPEEGKVIGTGTSQTLRFTYEVETDSRIYKLECDKLPKPGLTSYTPRECGGARKIQIGDVIHLRKDKSWAYIPIAEHPAEEQRLRILSEEAKSYVKPADSKAESKPDDKQ